MKVSVTGHRPERIGEPAICHQVKQMMRMVLLDIRSAERGVALLSGGARGVDLWAVEIAIKSSVPYELVLPFDDYAERWLDVDKAQLDYYRERALRIHTIGEPGKAAYFKRNRYLVDNCDLLVAVYDGKPGGGTAYTVDYARSVGREVRYVRW